MSQVHPAPRTAPRPDRQAVRRPPVLRLVGPPVASRRLLTRIATVVAAALAAAGLFSVVALHVFLAQGQAELDRLSATADAQAVRHGRLTVQVAQLASPDRVVAAARDRLGMVPPSTVVYLPAADPSSPLPPVGEPAARGRSSPTASVPPGRSASPAAKRP